MKALYQFTRKNLNENKQRTIVTIVGVVLTCILMFGICFGVTIYQNKQLDETVYHLGSYHFAYTDIDSYLLQKIKESKDVEDIEVEIILNHFKLSFYDVELVARSGYSLSNVIVLKGDYPKNNQEILIDTIISKFYQKDIGDSITIQGNTYKIVGFFEADNHVVQHRIYTYSDDVGDSMLNVYMTLKDPSDGLTKIHSLSESLGFSILKYTDGGYYEHELTNDAMLRIHGVYRNYLDFASMFLVLMLLLSVLSIVCILVIYNAFAISVMERKKTLGVLSSIGATPNQLLKSVLYEATVISLIAIPIGLFIAYMGANLIVMYANMTYYEILVVPLRLGIQPMYFILSFVFILITIYLSAFFPAMRAREVTPMEAILMHQDIYIKRKNIKSGKFIRKIFGVEGEIAYKNRKRNKKKYRIVTLSLIIGIVLFMSFSAYLDLQKVMISNNEIQDSSYNIINVTLSGELDLQQSYIDKLLDDVNVTKLKKFKGIVVKLDDSVKQFYTKQFQQAYPNFDRIQLVSLSDEEYGQYLNKIGGSEKKPIFRNNLHYTRFNETGKVESIVITKMFDEIHSLPLILSSFDNKESNGLVVDDFYVTEEVFKKQDTIFYPALYIPEDLYDKWVKSSNNIEFITEGLQVSYDIATEDFKKIEYNYQDLKEEYAALNISYYNIRYQDYQNILYLEVVNLLILGIILFIAFIAITSVINTIHTSMELRKKEFVMLRSIGMTPKQFYKMICLESFFFGVWSLLIGLLISTGIIYLLHEVLNVGLLPEERIDYPYPYKYMILTIIFVFIIILISMLYSTRKVKKDNIADVLKESNF